jgi:Novel STAND NTPase 1
MVDVATALRSAPYKGLASYTEADAELFFGRDRECEVILSNLRARRLTLLYGESGVGKSSLLRAGVAARLAEEAEEDARLAGRPDFVPVVFSAWRDDPAGGLARAIGSALGRFGEFDGSAPRAIGEAIEAAAALGSYVLVILDQFEEYFVYHPRADDGDAFAAQFTAALNTRGLQASFLISIREDALAKLDRFKAAFPRLFDGSLRIERLDPAAARQAIERPLDHYNAGSDDDARISIEPALVDAVVQQVTAGRVRLEQSGVGRLDGAAGEGVETPYLQLVMLRLWETERIEGSRVLRRSTLDALGGAERIVRTHLDGALSDLTQDERDAAADVFHHLVTPSGTKIAHSASDLAEYTGRGEAEIGGLLEKLATSETRIIRPIAPPPGSERPPRFEIYHDVLASPILDWRARQSAARRVAEEKRSARAARRRLLWRGGVAAAFVGLALVLAIVVLQRRNDTLAARNARLAAAQALRAERLSRTISAFSGAVTSRYNYVLLGRRFVFRTFTVVGPAGAAVRISCSSRACGTVRGTIPASGAWKVPLASLPHVELGSDIGVLVTHDGLGKQYTLTATHNGLNATGQVCRPRGSRIPVSLLPSPCRPT